MDTVIGKFIEQARKTPKEPAVMDIRGAYTYDVVNSRSASVAKKITGICGDRCRVGLLLPRTKDFVICLYAILRAGNCVVPIDYSYPDERAETILSDVGASLLITTRERAQAFSDLTCLVPEDVFPDEDDREDDTDLSIDLSDPDKDGYILYTSGSTGKPKGVIHRQFMLSNTLNQPYLVSMENIHTLCMAGFGFIACLLDIVPPLSFGGSVYIADEDERKSADTIRELIVKRKINGMFMPPSMYKIIRQMHGPLPLEYVLLSGEKVDKSITGDPGVFELYGASEAPAVLWHEAGSGREGCLGKPYPGVTVYITDENGYRIEGSKEIGELWVASPYVALGYNNLPGETEKRFDTDPFGTAERLFRTGDFAAWDDEGSVIFHGRKDRMVKISGYRVELGEIEKVLAACPGIDEAVCVPVKVHGGEKICAYYTGEEISPDTVKTHVKGSLPDYMVPGYVVRLDAIPRNERKKIDYQALAAMDPPVENDEYYPPENDTEERICRKFGEVLDIKRVSALGDFFELGGTSLLAMVLISDLKDLKKGLSFSDIASHPTPRSLAGFISAQDDEDVDIPGMDRDFYPLTKTQMGIYLESMTGGAGSTYSSPYLMKADPSVSADKLIEAVRTVVDAHPSMKYMIRTDADGIPHMFMTPEAEFDIPVIDGPDDGRLEFMKSFVPVVPVTDHLLFYFAVYRSQKRCYLALKGHLIFFDGTSISLLIAELNRALSGTGLLSEECTIQQASMREEHLISAGAFEKAKEYYRSLFKEMDDIPAITGDLAGQLTPGVSRNFRFEPESLDTKRVRDFCEKIQISESSFFMGAMALMLGKYLHTEHVSFSTVYNGRTLSQMNNTMGTLIKRIPVYGDLSEDKSVTDYLRQMSRQIFESMSNDIYPFDEVLKTCPVNEDVEFIYQGDLFTDRMGTSAGETLVEGDPWFMEQYHTGMVTGCFSIQLFSTGGFYNMTVEYRNERFSEKWVKSFSKHLFTIAEGLLKSENISGIPMIDDDDRRMLQSFNDTKIDIGFVPVSEQIRMRAKEHPDKTAVIASGRKLTFGELDRMSDIVAAYLVLHGLRKEMLVGMLLEREVYAYVATIGILKAGGAFVPFIPEYPDDRIRYCMEDGDIRILITQESIKKERDSLSDEGFKMITMEEMLGYDGNLPEFPVINDNDMAYCIYTSGTTGKPKGVMIEHRNIANYVHRNEKSIEIMNYGRKGRITLALASFSFDVSVVEEFVPLCNGNTVVIATDEEIHTPALLARLITENNIDGITCTPTYLMNLLDIPESRKALEDITFYDIGAEAFPPGLYDRLRKIRNDSVILNVYGPTEATMGCAATVMTGCGPLTVGGPIANTEFLVSDTFGNPLPAGIRGELIICGDQVGRGYINPKPENAAAFFTYNGMRAYHSGDLAEWTDDGKIRLYGRIDNQIKLRGFRIELDEIENVMSGFSGIKTAAVAVRKHNGTDHLVGYYMSDSKTDIAKLKKHMHEKLPEYMVPTVFTEVAEMPLTINGKVDKKALPQPDFSVIKAEYVMPATETEKKICAAFASVLKLDEKEVGALDDFFELGGDSLKSMIVVAQADLDGLEASDIFRKRTPREVAAAVDSRRDLGSLDEREDKARNMPHDLTQFQTEVLDHQLFYPSSTMWSNMHFLLRFSSDIDAEKLCDAVNLALKNHPSLSVAFGFDENGDLKQRYVPGLLPGVKVREASAKLEEMLPSSLIAPFHKLLDSCLCRVNVFKGKENCYLFMDAHHMLMDGGSLGYVLRDIVDAYFGRELKKDYYFSILAAEEKRISEGEAEADKKYFTERYGGIEWCRTLPPDDPDGSLDIVGRTIRFTFSPDDVRRAEEKTDATLSVMATAAGLIALHRFTENDDCMVNWVFNNRLSPESENAVGMLIKNLPAAFCFTSETTVEDVLKSVKEQTASGIAHCLYDYMSEQRRVYSNECLEINMQLGINGIEADELDPEPLQMEDGFSAARLGLEMKLLENEFRDGMYDSLMEYAKGFYETGRIERFQDMYVEIIEEMVLSKTGQIKD